VKVDFSKPICNLDGTQYTNQDGKPITLGTISAEALLNLVPQDSGEQRAKDGWLAERIFSAGAIDIGLEDAARIKKRIGDTMPPLIVGRAWALLDPKPAVEKAA
jgi:hypothetical protein